MFYEQSIYPAGFGEYQVKPINGEGWTTFDDLLAETRQSVADQGGELAELTDEGPDWADDIRGRIHNEPERVFAIRWAGGEIAYIGIVEIPGQLSEDELAAIRDAAEGHAASLSNEPWPASPDDVDGWETCSLPVLPRDDDHETAIRQALRVAICEAVIADLREQMAEYIGQTESRDEREDAMRAWLATRRGQALRALGG
jgi:hypothetical protein